MAQTPEKRPVAHVPVLSTLKKARSKKLRFEDRLGDVVPEAEAALLAELHDIVHGAPAPFACGGQLRIPEAPKVVLKAGESFAIKPPTLRSNASDRFMWGVSKKDMQNYVEDQTASLRGLCDKMLPASFGHGQETKIDPTVRDALQLAAEAFEVNIPEASLVSVLRELQQKLKIDSEVQAELYALNVYQKDGHFARHKDTPRGEDMLGSLVVCLPAFFEGGELLIEQGLDQKQFFRSRRFAPENWRKPIPEELTSLEWCAFFADVDHMVKKVSAGMRITVSYLLRRKDGQDASSEIPRCLSEDSQHQLMREAFQRAAQSPLLTEGKSIGFPCFFLYTNTEVFPKKADAETPLLENIVQKLKGRDAIVANSALAAGLKVRLVPYLSHDYSGEFDDGPAEIPLKRFPGKKRVPRRMSDDSIEVHFDTSLDEDSRMEGQPDVWVMTMERAASRCAGSTEWNAEGYFGNEASGISFYVKAGLHVSIDWKILTASWQQG